MVEHGRLQTESHHGGPEDQCAIDITTQFGCLARCEQNGDCHVEKEEQHQEGLGGTEKLRAVTEYAPCCTNDECEQKAGQVERPPCFEPGYCENCAVEHGVVTEQDDVAASPGGCKDGSEEAAGHGEKRECL